MSREKEYRNESEITGRSTARRDWRSMARRLAVQFLYQLEVQGDKGLENLESFLQEFCANDKARQLAQRWIKGAWADREDIDERIGKVSSNWQLSRINQVDRSNLRLAVYEMLRCPDIPVKVVINEAVELAKIFSTVQSPGFINGVLDTIRRKLKK